MWTVIQLSQDFHGFVSAFLSEIGISVGQLKVNDKSNEETTIPKLLDIIDIKNMIVTIDAVGTQENIANKIIENKGDFVLNVKDNQKDLKDDIKTYGEKITLKKKMTRYMLDFSNIENLIFEVIPSI